MNVRLTVRAGCQGWVWIEDCDTSKSHRDAKFAIVKCECSDLQAAIEEAYVASIPPWDPNICFSFLFFKSRFPLFS